MLASEEPMDGNYTRLVRHEEFILEVTEAVVTARAVGPISRSSLMASTDISALVSAVQIDGIRLVEASLKTEIATPPGIPIEAEAGHKTSVLRRPEKDSGFLILVDVTFAIKEAEGKANAVFNAWAVWREFLQSSLLRIGLPPITLQVSRQALQAEQTRDAGRDEHHGDEYPVAHEIHADRPDRASPLHRVAPFAVVLAATSICSLARPLYFLWRSGQTEIVPPRLL